MEYSVWSILEAKPQKSLEATGIRPVVVGGGFLEAFGALRKGARRPFQNVIAQVVFIDIYFWFLIFAVNKVVIANNVIDV